MDLIHGATTDLAVWQLTLMAVISLVVGLSGGIVGIALGVIRLPMLTFFGVDPLIAAGTNLMISVMGSTIGDTRSVSRAPCSYVCRFGDGRPGIRWSVHWWILCGCSTGLDIADGGHAIDGLVSSLLNRLVDSDHADSPTLSERAHSSRHHRRRYGRAEVGYQASQAGRGLRVSPLV